CCSPPGGLGPPGFEPGTKGLCLPPRLSPPTVPLFVVWTVPSPRTDRSVPPCPVSTPSPGGAWLGVGMGGRLPDPKRSPNLRRYNAMLSHDATRRAAGSPLPAGATGGTPADLASHAASRPAQVPCSAVELRALVSIP